MIHKAYGVVCFIAGVKKISNKLFIDNASAVKYATENNLSGWHIIEFYLEID